MKKSQFGTSSQITIETLGGIILSFAMFSIVDCIVSTIELMLLSHTALSDRSW